MSCASNEVRLARAALTRICEPASHGLADLVAKHGPVEALARLRHGSPPKDIAGAVEIRRDEDRSGRDLDDIDALGGRLVCPEDEEWPVQLDDLAAVSTRDDPIMPPVAVWVRGTYQLADVCNRSVSIVGARAASPYGTHVAGELAYGLADRGWTVVSGGAYGIDGSGHRGALAAAGRTVAVLASGVDRPYPLGHQALFDRIAAEGLLISEWPPGCSPQRLRFLVRNRVIAALSRGTLVVEAAARSGARMTARRANDLCRPLMAVPGPVTSAMSVGAHQLIRSGATLVSSAAEVIDLVGQVGADMAEPPRGPCTSRDALAPELAQLLDGMPARHAARPEEIAAQAGLRLGDALRALPLLAAQGFIEEHGSGYRLRRAKRQRVGAQRS